MATNIAKARDRERETLIALACLGYLTTMQIGQWVYSSNAEHTQRCLAHRLTRRMEKSGDIKRRNDVRGVTVWILTNRGAARTASETDGRISPSAGYDRQTAGCDYTHDCVVRHLTTMHRLGYTAIGRTGLRDNIGGYAHIKGLDGIVSRNEYDAYGLVVVSSAHEVHLHRYVRIARQMRVKLLGERWAVARIKEQAAALL